ncbi:MAG TPA: SidA/IucD/PvdA family monooxygenase [Candidatus Corynebacterium gallistercoris]|uniref:L-lysine N6-monooxygenase MbtG n=1 Tax=Candidatus Corynebacterium gallistercoris TaxID=2838530 RepID=A0A9D1RZW1_9CORY|nr:SidA/IucD/PvdA family monooxygenase [Candidatus Corynebacterium gallistercoris]
MYPSSPATGAIAHENHPDGDVLDLVGIGIGPFNLGLAALANPLIERGELTAAFVDSRSEFCWHPGVMFSDATIQVPFMADLVTMADPTSRFSFLNYLKTHQRIYPFYIRESFYPYRKEYSDYCSWVAAELDFLHWSSPVTRVRRSPHGHWEINIEGPSPRTLKARAVVNGTGTEPVIPDSLSNAAYESSEGILHSSQFLDHKDHIMAQDSVTIVGSGQSAAEIYRYLIEDFTAAGKRLDWFTRSPRFFPMEYTALTLELTSPDYARFFHSLPESRRDELNRAQRNLYKGISGDLIDDIYDTLYRLSITTPLRGALRSNVTVGLADSGTLSTDGSTGQHTLALRHNETGAEGFHATDVVILATGYGRPTIPSHLASIEEINLDASGRMDVAPDFTVNDAQDLYVLNAEEHTHSLNAPDLGMGAWRNSIILNHICRRDIYQVEQSTVFQTFGGEGL